MPADCVYRQTTEALVRERLALVESTVDIAQLEEKIGMGQIEEVLWQVCAAARPLRTHVYFRRDTNSNARVKC
jgi:hypothetical protein